MPQAEFDSIRTLRTLAHLRTLGSMELGATATGRRAARDDVAGREDQTDGAREAQPYGKISRSR